ncbi:MAG: hypothetical protein IJJ73_11135 [Bacteroidaceae bacterium]|nr:hypothetical protein [Bacteroidaceae bacterium]
MRKNLLNLCLTALMCVVSTTAWALSEVNGVYQIGTAEDLEEFTALVNKGNRFANALLTADIVKSSPSTMIGTDAIEYEGIFDGAGHSITIDLKTESRGIALFRWVGRKGIVKDLKVQGEITTSSDWAAAIAVETRGIVRGCYVDVKINSTRNGDATDGAIAFRTSTGTIVEDCLAKLNIQGASTQNCGGVVGWANGKTSIVNCLAINSDSNFDISNGASNSLARNPGNVKFVNVESYNADNYANRPDGGSYNNYVTDLWGAAAHGTVTQVNVEDLADGRICYQLNNDQSRIAWVQNIGTDPFPVPAAFGTGQVYASVPTNCAGKAEGDVTYSNNGTDQATKHTLDAMGICTTCGYFDFHAFDYCYEFGSDRYVKLANTTDIDRCEVWNKAIGGFKLNMKMVDDIEYKAEPGRFIFNATDWVDGDFNGDGHVLTIEMSDITVNGASFIPCQYMGTFENVIMHGSITTTGQYAASISSWARQYVVRNVYSDVTINANNSSDNTAGGFFGIAYYNKSVENCIYAGNIGGGPYIGGFSGWANDPTSFTNCAVLGNVEGREGDNSQNICRNPGNVRTNNCYVVNLCPTATDNDKVTHYTNTDGIASGELAFLLNGSQGGVERFYQVIGIDQEPMPIAKEGGLVYAVATEYRCDGLPLGETTYTNTATTPTIPDHNFVDGVCSVCGSIETDEDDYAKIINAKTMIAFANKVNAGENGLKARMYADIDMKDAAYTPAGTTSKLFVGEFDGQGHKFSNFKYSGGDYSGLFGVIGGGAVIKNFVLDSSCSISGNAFCGIIGGTIGSGDVYISNLGNEGSVTGGAQNASGIIGVDQGGAANLFITNCYVMGAVVGARESATICSWSSANSVVKNCWSTATLSGKYGDEDSFTRGSAACVNCYEIEGVGTQNNKTGANRTNIVTAEEVANGSLCAKLAEGWYQAIGTDAHPVWDKSHGIVKEITEAGYATMYIGEAVDAPAGVAAYTGTIGGSWLTLNPIEGTIPAWEPVVLKGAAGFYSFKPAEAAAQADELTWEGLGLVATNASYNPFSGKSFTSPAEYAGTASSGQGKYIQLRTKNSNEGIVTTTSGGKLKSVTIAFNTATFDRSIKIYGKNEPYTDATDLYNSEKQGTLIGVIAANDKTFTVAPTESFKYVGMASSNGAIYIDKITVEWEGSVPNIEGNDLKGTAEDIEAAGKYVLTQPEGKVIGFYLADQGTIKAGKAYLEGASGIKAFLFNDEATGISNVNVNENGAIYNLAGQRLNKMHKGINIINGKKVLK